MHLQQSPGAVLPPVRPAFRALARTIVPEASDLDDAGWREFEAIVERALSKRPPGMRRQLVVFIRLLDLLPRFRWLRPFRKLDAGKRARFLRAIQSSRVFLVRRGFWGLRTLVFMGYYARPRAYAEIGYDAHLRGWLGHPDADDDARQATLRDATTETPGTPHGPRSAGADRSGPAGTGGGDGDEPGDAP